MWLKNAAQSQLSLAKGEVEKIINSPGNQTRIKFNLDDIFLGWSCTYTICQKFCYNLRLSSKKIDCTSQPLLLITKSKVSLKAVLGGRRPKVA